MRALEVLPEGAVITATIAIMTTAGRGIPDGGTRGCIGSIVPGHGIGTLAGCDGVILRIRYQPFSSPLPSVFLANVRSITNKMDEIKLQLACDQLCGNCAVLIFTETWHGVNDPVCPFELAERTLFRADRTMESGKKKGGGLCVYIHQKWCSDVDLIETYCSAELEYMLLKYRPFYLPQEISVVVVAAVYIPPRADISKALDILYVAISRQLTKHPDCVVVVADDYNQANLKSVFPKFTQNVKVATRGNNTLDHVYTNIKDAYKSIRCPHIGQSDHVSLLLVPIYLPVVKRIKPTVREITTWPEGAWIKLQDCLDRTDWDFFL